jgi:hypothetical protein
MIYLQRYFTNIDLFWDAALTTSLAVVEVNIGIVCDCLPCVKPFHVKILPSLFGSTGRTGEPGQSYPFKDVSAQLEDQDGSTSILRAENLGETIDGSESDGGSAHSSTNSVLIFDEKGQVRPTKRSLNASSKNEIMLNRTVTVKRSWVTNVYYPDGTIRHE